MAATADVRLQGLKLCNHVTAACACLILLLTAGMMSYFMMTFSATFPATGPACLQTLSTLLQE